MLKRNLAFALLLILIAGTVFAGEKLIDHEKFTGKTTFTFKGDLKEEWFDSLKEGKAAFVIIKTETNLVESVLADFMKGGMGYEEKGKQKLLVNTKNGKMTWTIKGIPTSEYLRGGVGIAEEGGYVDFQIREIDVKLSGKMSMVKAPPCYVTLKEAFHNEGTQVFQNYEIMPTVKGKNLKYNYKDENEKIKMTISGKTKEYTLTWTLNQECVIPKFTQPISEE